VTLSDEVLTIVHAFPAGDERRDEIRNLAKRVAALEAEAERDEARRIADVRLRARDEAIDEGRAALAAAKRAESRAAALADALRALHDIVLAREAGATDLLPDLARAMARARAVLDG
jgi:hypothetical protein